MAADDPGRSAAAGDLPAHIPPALVLDYEDVLGPNRLDDPFAPAREALGRLPPVFFARSRFSLLGGPGSWICTRYEDIREVFQNSDRYSSAGVFSFQYLIGESWPAIPLSIDPPDHEKYRLLLNPFFSPKAVTQLEGEIYGIVNALIDGFADQGGCDAAYDFGRIYPVKVFMGLMGFPQARFEDFLTWGYAILHEMSDIERVKWGARGALAYLRGFIEEVRRAPREGLASRVVHGQVEGRPLTEDEIIGVIFFLWIGGLDTVAATSTLMFRRLAVDTALQAKLRASPELIPDAIEEFLRMNPTVNPARVAKEDHELHGVAIRKGDRLNLMVAAGNFDPAEFEAPEAFNAQRGQNRHLTFVAGVHRCLGSHLARRELRIALAEVFRRIPPFRLQPGADRTVIPGLIAAPHLPLVWDA
jgi:cytochrome P450